MALNNQDTKAPALAAVGDTIAVFVPRTHKILFLDNPFSGQGHTTGELDYEAGMRSFRIM